MGALLAFALGALLGTAITASLFRANESRNVRNAIASVRRYLMAESNKPLGDMTGKLKLHLDVINEADDLVTRSDWARREKHRFVSLAVQMIRLRNKGVKDAQLAQLEHAQKRLKKSGNLLIGYLQFPSWLWVWASTIRGIAALQSKRLSSKSAPAPQARS